MVVIECEVWLCKVFFGEKVMILGGEFVNFIQDLGGNYMVIWCGNMLCIDGIDVDVIGRKL